MTAPESAPTTATAAPSAHPLPLVRHHREGGDERPRLLDLCCCAGGAAVGYHRAGFDVVGVDKKASPNYPFRIIEADALAVLADLDAYGLADVAAIHASFPCQLFSVTQKRSKRTDHLDLVTPGRELLKATGLPWVMENVPGEHMHEPLILCGTEFGLTARDRDGTLLHLKRHRAFEGNVQMWGAGGCWCYGQKIGGVYGNGGEWRRTAPGGGGYKPSVEVRKALLGIDWPMDTWEVSQAIPPVFTEYIGAFLLDAVKSGVAA